jgi:hypothetical protein
MCCVQVKKPGVDVCGAFILGLLAGLRTVYFFMEQTGHDGGLHSKPSPFSKQIC